MFKHEDILRRCPNCDRLAMAHQAMIENQFDIRVMFLCDDCHRGWDHLIEFDIQITAPR